MEVASLRCMGNILRLIPALAALALIGCTSGASKSDPSVAVAADRVRGDAAVTITASGFPADSDVVIGSGPPHSEYDVMVNGRTDANGELRMTVPLPRERGEELVFVVATPDNRIRAVSEAYSMDEEPEAGAITITGKVTGEGVECKAVRSDEGALYTITGAGTEKLQEGARVRITGTIAQISFCMQGTTISATDVTVLQ